MKGLLTILAVLLVAGALLGQAMVEDTGYVLIAYKQTSIETSIWVLCIATILLFTLLYFTLSILTHIRSPITSLRDWNQTRLERKAERRAHEGILARAEGDWWRARRELLQAARTSHTPTIYYLEAAEMAARNGDEKEVGRILDAALKAAPEAKEAIQLSRAQFETRLGHTDKAAELLQDLVKQQPKNLQVKQLQAKIYAEQHNWSELYPLIAELKRNKLINDSEATRYRKDAATGLLEAVDKEHAARPIAHRVTELNKQWSAFGFETQQNTQVRQEYLKCLLHLGEFDSAEKMIGDWLSKDWDETLLLRYSELKASDINAQLKRAKSWLKQQPDNAALELCLGRLSQRAQLWGAAIAHYKRSLEIEPHAQTILELSDLYLNLGEQHQATQLLRGYNKPLNLPAPSAEDRETRKSLA